MRCLGVRLNTGLNYLGIIKYGEKHIQIEKKKKSNNWKQIGKFVLSWSQNWAWHWTGRDNREDAAIERKINGRVLLWIWGRIPSRVPPRNVAMCFQCTTFGLRRLPRSPGSHSSSVSVFTRDMTKKKMK